MNPPKPRYLNSAGRLLAVLESLQPKKTAEQLIAIMFDSEPPKDAGDLSIIGIKAITELHLLYVTFLQDLTDANISDKEKSVLQSGLSTLENLMYPAALNQGMRPASESEKALLEVCATRLPEEDDLAEEDLNRIRESIKSLRDTIEELPSDSVLRRILLELTRLSEDAVNRFNIYGAKGLKRAFKDMLAEVAEVYLQDEEKLSEIKETSNWQILVQHLKLFDSIAAKLMKYTPYIEKGKQFLLGD